MSRNLIRYGRITKRLTRKGQFAVQQTTYQGKVADAHMIHPYGLHANVPADTLALLLAVQGNPDNRAAFAMDSKAWPTLEDGEVALYHPSTGGMLVWKTDGSVEITTSVGMTINADLTINGTVTNNGKNIGDTHGHTQGNDSGGDTEQPITGVT